MKWYPAFFLLLLMSAAGLSCGKSNVDKMPTSVAFFDGSLEQALEKAKSENKKVFVVGYTNWCKYCKVLFKGTLADTEVGDYMNRHFVSLKLNMETKEGRKLAKEWNVTGFPTSLVLDSEGNVKALQPGALNKEDFLDFVKKAG